MHAYFYVPSGSYHPSHDLLCVFSLNLCQSLIILAVFFLALLFFILQKKPFTTSGLIKRKDLKCGTIKLDLKIYFNKSNIVAFNP